MGNVACRFFFFVCAFLFSTHYTAFVFGAQYTFANSVAKKAYALLFGPQRAALFFGARQAAREDALDINNPITFKYCYGSNWGFIQALNRKTYEQLGEVEYKLHNENPPYLCMDYLHTEKYYRKHGLGRQLFSRVYKQAAAANVHSIVWVARPFDIPEGTSEAQAFRQLRLFYEKLGGKPLHKELITKETVAANMIFVLPKQKTEPEG